MARMGMDVEQVESAGHNLQNRGQQIQDLVGQIDGIVHGLASIWDGKDAQTFVNEWWPQHKAALKSAGDAVSGLGQSALNNASEQRNVSSH